MPLPASPTRVPGYLPIAISLHRFHLTLPPIQSKIMRASVGKTNGVLSLHFQIKFLTDHDFKTLYASRQIIVSYFTLRMRRHNLQNQ